MQVKTYVYRFIYILLAVSSISSCKVSLASKEALKTELAAILSSDQDLRNVAQNQKLSVEKREEILAKYQLKSEDYLSHKLWEAVDKNDSLNLLKVEKIIKKYGYPGKSMVGEPLNEAVFFVIQHADTKMMEKYFPMIKKAGAQGEISNRKVAMMQDRILMDNNKEQIYGTQVAGRLFIDPDTKKEEWKNFLWPVKDYSTVNTLREKMGFNYTVEDYVKSMGLESLKKYTLEEIKQQTKPLQ